MTPRNIIIGWITSKWMQPGWTAEQVADGCLRDLDAAGYVIVPKDHGSPAFAAAAERERCEAKIDRLEEALHRIESWSRAYPLSIFPEPDLKKAAAVLKANGMTLDAISAHAMRHVVEGVGKIAAAHIRKGE